MALESSVERAISVPDAPTKTRMWVFGSRHGQKRRIISFFTRLPRQILFGHTGFPARASALNSVRALGLAVCSVWPNNSVAGVLKKKYTQSSKITYNPPFLTLMLAHTIYTLDFNRVGSSFKTGG